MQKYSNTFSSTECVWYFTFEVYSDIIDFGFLIIKKVLHQTNYKLQII